jgi:uncharacterized protein (TIGR00297 family)
MITGLDEAITNRILLSLILGGCAGVVSYLFRFLTKSGSFSAGVLAVVLYTCGGWQWLFPMVVFFLPSSVLSHLRKKLRPEMDSVFEKSETRDSVQVLVNGGVGGALALVWFIHQNPVFYVMYLGSLSAAMADTWETEIGVMSGGKTYQILSFKRVPSGTSGAVSFAGLFGGVCASAIIAFSGLPWISAHVHWSLFMIFISGIAGSLVDSVTGAIVQGQYQCSVCGSITERKIHCHIIGTLKNGSTVITNDVVNILCNVAGALTVLIFSWVHI